MKIKERETKNFILRTAKSPMPFGLSMYVIHPKNFKTWMSLIFDKKRNTIKKKNTNGFVYFK